MTYPCLKLLGKIWPILVWNYGKIWPILVWNYWAKYDTSLSETTGQNMTQLCCNGFVRFLYQKIIWPTNQDCCHSLTWVQHGILCEIHLKIFCLMLTSQSWILDGPVPKFILHLHWIKIDGFHSWTLLSQLVANFGEIILYQNYIQHSHRGINHNSSKPTLTWNPKVTSFKIFLSFAPALSVRTKLTVLRWFYTNIASLSSREQLMLI